MGQKMKGELGERIRIIEEYLGGNISQAEAARQARISEMTIDSWDVSIGGKEYQGCSRWSKIGCIVES